VETSTTPQYVSTRLTNAERNHARNHALIVQLGARVLLTTLQGTESGRLMYVGPGLHAAVVRIHQANGARQYLLLDILSVVPDTLCEYCDHESGWNIGPGFDITCKWCGREWIR
jgi:hypothetical protein